MDTHSINSDFKLTVSSSTFSFVTLSSSTGAIEFSSTNACSAARSLDPSYLANSSPDLRYNREG